METVWWLLGSEYTASAHPSPVTPNRSYRTTSCSSPSYIITSHAAQSNVVASNEMESTSYAIPMHFHTILIYQTKKKQPFPMSHPQRRHGGTQALT